MDLVWGHDALVSRSQHQKLSPECHILAVLYFLGVQGNTASPTWMMNSLGVGKGSVNSLVEWGINAILSLKEEAITWPSATHEWNETSKQVKKKSGFPNCVGIIDGTLLPLQYQPTVNEEDYKGRKLSYSVNAMIICDDNALIQDYVVGWLGSTHSNRVWSNMDLCLNSHKYFAVHEYAEILLFNHHPWWFLLSRNHLVPF